MKDPGLVIAAAILFVVVTVGIIYTSSRPKPRVQAGRAVARPAPGLAGLFSFLPASGTVYEPSQNFSVDVRKLGDPIGTARPLGDYGTQLRGPDASLAPNATLAAAEVQAEYGSAPSLTTGLSLDGDSGRGLSRGSGIF